MAANAQETESPYAKQVYELARKVEADVLPKQRPAYLDMVAAHEIDTKSYTFEARRFGDFLAMFISRGGDKYVHALNLGQTREIRLVPGRVPDMEGMASYYVSFASDDGGTGTGGRRLTEKDLTTPPRGYHYKVDAWMPYSSPRRPMIVVVAVPSTSSGPFLGSLSRTLLSDENFDAGNYFGLKTPGIARDAVDDRIVFTGIETTIYAPAGRGAEIRDSILDAIAQGAPKEWKIGVTP